MDISGNWILWTVFLMGCLPAFASFMAIRKPRPLSLRLANFALGCGFLGMVAVEPFFFRENGTLPFYAIVICGIVRVGISLIGIVLAILAYRNRGDGGVGWGRPLAAVLVCLQHLHLVVYIFTTDWIKMS
jgi:hypothetical protein